MSSTLQAERAGRKRAEEALLESEERLRLLAENARDIIYRVRMVPDQAFEYVSPAATTMTGYTPEDHYADPMLGFKLVHPDDIPILEAVSRGDIPLDAPLILRWVRKDGSVLWVEQRNVYLFDDEGTLVAIEGIARDITRQKEAEDALRRERDRSQKYLDIAGVMFIVLDSQGIVSLVNRRACEIFGYSQEEIIGKDWFEHFIPERTREQVRRVFHQLMAGDVTPVAYVENVVLVRGGQERIIGWRNTVIRDDSGEVVGIIGSGEDITHRKRIEQELKDERSSLARQVDEKTTDLKLTNQELARAIHTRDEFLAMISHELRTPLHAILTLSESLREQVYGTLNDKQDHSLHLIEESGRHLLDMINDILDIARLEAGKIVLCLDDVDVERVCLSSIRFVQEEAHKKHITITHQIDEQVQNIWADERRLKQILVNLLSNAVKFTDKGGHIGVTVQADDEQRVVHFTVWDTGIGISPEESKLLFRPFVQLDSSLSRQYQGTGLGLVVVARLTELHGGSVSLWSEKGAGSHFTISLPWSPEGSALLSDRSPNSDAIATESLHQGTLVLLVDDNNTSLTVMTEYLQTCGYHIIAAQDGVEAIEQARRHRPAIILMDIQMPMMDGMEAIQRVHALEELAHVPIIALTSLAMPGDREQCLQAGASDYYCKPISLKKLVQVIEQWVSSSRP